MVENKSRTMYFGAGFEAQPDHKKKILPLDFLSAFYNVDSDNEDEIWEFANKYNFGWYLFPDENRSTKEKFTDIQKKYHPILKDLINKGSINRNDFDIINKDLSDTSPTISLRHTVNDLDKIEESFCLYVLTAVGGEEPDYAVERKGSLEYDTEEKTSLINITMKVPNGSKSKWYVRRVMDGVRKAPELFPSGNWALYKSDLRYAVFTDGHIEFDEKREPILITMNLRLGKVRFTKEELSAVWSPTTGESFIAKRIWDYINSEYVGYNFNLCKICGKMHLGKSKYFCENPKCELEWDAKRKKIEYDLKKKK